MRRSTSALALAAGLVMAGWLSLPSLAHAYPLRHGFGHGFSHRLGHSHFGHGFGHGSGHRFGRGYFGHGSGFHGYGVERPPCDCGSVKIEVLPEVSGDAAQVRVDGAHAGVVGDFDGLFQRLRLPVGSHEIEITHPGSKTFRKRILVSRGRTYALQHRLEPAMSQVQRDPRPVDSAAVEAQSPKRGEEAVGLSYGTLRLQVAPRQAQVFVDGAHAGVVDDFDGTFQRLTLPTGSHEIEITLDGHRTFREKVLISPRSTHHVRHRLQPTVQVS